MQNFDLEASPGNILSISLHTWIIVIICTVATIQKLGLGASLGYKLSIISLCLCIINITCTIFTLNKLGLKESLEPIIFISLHICMKFGLKTPSYQIHPINFFICIINIMWTTFMRGDLKKSQSSITRVAFKGPPYNLVVPGDKTYLSIIQCSNMVWEVFKRFIRHVRITRRINNIQEFIIGIYSGHHEFMAYDISLVGWGRCTNSEMKRTIIIFISIIIK